MTRDDNQLRAPIVEALQRYEAQGSVSLHVPGHKDGAAYAKWGANDEGMAEVFQRYAALLGQDVTEVDGTDDLHQPTGAIREAQELAAACFGAEETHFLVGGSTSGNVAAVLTCCTEPGDLVLVQRNVHKSVLNGLRLAGARAVFLSPRIDRASGLATAPAAAAVQQALARYPQAKAVIASSPNYFGLGVDVQELAAAAHAANVPLIVDEAHGAHYGMHAALPSSALQAGADLVIQSTHKMLGGMTMSAMLHVQGPWVDRIRLKRMLTMVQSSSPSYPLLASLDMSRYMLAVKGEALFTEGLNAVNKVRQALNQYRHLSEMQTDKASVTQDPFKLVLTNPAGTWSGYRLLEELGARGCVAEMADERYVVLLFSFSSTNQDANKLVEALNEMDNQLDQVGTNTASADLQSRMISLWDDQDDIEAEPVAFSIYTQQEDAVRIPVNEAAGACAAESVIPYPPGIPVLYEGERISEKHVELLLRLSAQGAKYQDVQDPTLQHIQIYRSADR